MTNKIELLNLLIQEDRQRMPKLMRAFYEPRRYKFAWGGRGAGKSESIAKILLYRANKEKIRILCAREIQDSIADSVYSLLKDLIKELHYTNYEPTKNAIRNIKTGSEFIFTGLYGQDKKQTIKSTANIDIAWVEEAQAVSETSIKILDPTIRKENSEVWFSFNRLFPDDPVWLFKQRMPDDKKIDVKINYNDNPYLPKVLLEQAELSKQEYEKGLSDDYLNIWLGDPIGQSEKTIFKLREIEDAMTREINPEGAIEVGADIARHGKDRTVLIKRKGLKMLDMRIYQNNTVVETANYIKDFIDYDKSVPVKVDDTGVGGGVTDILKSEGYRVIPINFGERANDPDKYPNAISEMWFTFKSNIGSIQLMSHQELKSELITREFDIDNKGRRAVEAKDKYKKRFYKSPDIADALLLAFYERDNSIQIFLV